MRDEELYVRRGNLLWEGMRMMLPEHKQELIKLEADDWKVPLHGELDDDQWWDIGEIIMDAQKHTTEINLRYWNNGFYKDQVCYIHKVDHDGKRIRIEHGPVNDTDREWVMMRHVHTAERL